MLIVPVFNKGERKIPYICVALILINSCIYFFLQSDDHHIKKQAYDYYEASGLVEIELKAYLKYAQSQGEDVPEELPSVAREQEELFWQMFGDGTFQKLLINNRIITASDEGFTDWRKKRDEFEEIENRSIAYKYGYSPRRNNLLGLFTCMFLHGGVMHLVGNMVFLWLVGAILEKALGAGWFLFLYVVSGICASGLFGLVYPLTPGPLVGASGAIAGLMGAYGIIFYLRKIRIFYSLGFYFGYASIPAIALFPLWLGAEIFQLVTNRDSNVAYMAHIGGLLSGIVIGAVFRHLLKARIDGLFYKEESASRLELLLKDGTDKLVALDLLGARRSFNQALTLDPQNPMAIRQIFNIDKSRPESEEFHSSAHNLLQRYGNNPDEYLAVYQEYSAATAKPRINMAMLERLSHCYLLAKNLSKASSTIALLLKNFPDNRKLPSFLLGLAHGYSSTNNDLAAKKCYQVLAARYSTSEEGVKALEQLRPGTN